MKYKEKLSDLEYSVTRLKGTEPAFTGCYWNHSDDGIYKCKCCDSPLFSSVEKFNSGTGWPSYKKPIDDSLIKKIQDNSHGMHRTEVTCKNCDAHLGHVFDDGPKPSGIRYCINSVSLSFEKNN